jgi:hypothetical protein
MDFGEVEAVGLSRHLLDIVNTRTLCEINAGLMKKKEFAIQQTPNVTKP